MNHTIHRAFGSKLRKLGSMQYEPPITTVWSSHLGDQWSGAWSWRHYNDDFLLDDPAHHIMYEAHQYFDLDHSGFYKLDYARKYDIDTGGKLMFWMGMVKL